MSQFNVEASVIETEVSEQQTLMSVPTDDGITELSSAQMFMVGGGAVIFLE